MRHPGHTSNRSWFIPGVRSERGEEAELPGGQQWLVIAAGTSSSDDRGLRKPAACLPASTGQRMGCCSPPSWSHPVIPEKGEGEWRSTEKWKYVGTGAHSHWAKEPKRRGECNSVGG